MQHLDVFDPLGSDPSRCCHPERRHLFALLALHSLSRPARLCRSGRHDSSGESDGISNGLVKGPAKLSENPKSRSCRVIEVWVAYGVQYVASAGVNRLQAVNRVREKEQAYAYGVSLPRGRILSWRF